MATPWQYMILTFSSDTPLTDNGETPKLNAIKISTACNKIQIINPLNNPHFVSGEEPTAKKKSRTLIRNRGHIQKAQIGTPKYTKKHSLIHSNV